MPKGVYDHSKNTNHHGSASASLQKNFDGEKSDVQKAVGIAYHWFNYKPVVTDDECADRLNEFFQYCHDEGAVPTIELMCLALGYPRQTIWRWQMGEYKAPAPLMRDMIQKAKDMISSIDAQLVSTGKLNTVAYIFRAKNFYGMKDVVENVQVVATDNALSADDLSRKYIDAVPQEVPVLGDSTASQGMLGDALGVPETLADPADPS